MWRNFFLKDRRGPKELFLSYRPDDYQWSMITWNFGLTLQSERQWIIESLGSESRRFSIQWKAAEGKEEIRFSSKAVTPQSNTKEELQGLMNIAIHSTLKFRLEENHEFMLTAVSGATTLDIQNETKALQWIQASFGTLKRALDKIENDKDLIMTGGVFAGIEPQSGERVLRLLAMNLDIFYYLRPDFSVQIVVFDDKGVGHGSSKSPVFQQIIKVTKPQFYDEIVKLVNRFAVVGEVK
jgi:hypothetical protein